LADDLRRYRAHRPVLAHDGGAVYRIGCLLRRQPLASALVAAAAIGLVGAAVVANLGRLEARRAQVQAQRSERTALATTDFLVSVFRAPDPRANPGLDLTARELLARGVDGIGGLDAEPAVQVRLLDAFGQVTAALGAYDRSEALLQDAIEIYARKQLDEPLRLAALRNQLGQVQSDRDNLGAAEGSFRQALAELQSAGLAESAQAAELHSNLGVALRRQGRIDEAVVEYRQSIAMGERIVAPGQYSVLLNLGALELSRGRHADALQWLRQAAAAFPADLPENHPSRSVLHTNIAVAARNLGHLGEALAHAQRADAIDRVALGADHPDRAPTMQGLAVAQWRLGEREAAIATLQDALAVLDAALGPGHPRSALLWRTLAMLQIDAGDLPAARGSVQRADVAMRDAPPAQAGRGRVLNRLCEAELERRAGRFDPAALAAQTALDAAQALALPNDAALAAQLSALIALDAGRGDLARARWQMAQELAGCVSGRCVLDSPERLQLRAQWLARQGEFERAFAVLDAALGDAGWTAGMLALPGLEGMHGDPRWPGLQQKLASRMAVDGTPPGQAR
jgi:serine/threonine-protein kinase